MHHARGLPLKGGLIFLASMNVIQLIRAQSPTPSPSSDVESPTTAFGGPTPSAATTPSSTSSSACADLAAACEGDAMCQGCLGSASLSDTPWNECADRYYGPVSYPVGGGERRLQGSFCEVAGAEMCCEWDFYMATTCLRNDAMALYRQCQMDYEGCLLDDMPCYYGTLVTTSSDATSPAPTAGTETAPTGVTTSDSSAASGPGGFTMTPSPSPSSDVESPPTAFGGSTNSGATTPSPTSSSTCADLAAACQGDAVCQACLASLSDTPWNECGDRYPDLFEILGGENGRAGSFCELAGAEICCEFDDNVSAASCLENDAMALYRQCQMVDEGCLLDEMPCYGDLVTTTPSMAVDSTTPAPAAASGSGVFTTTPAPSTSVASSSSSAEGARGLELTPSPAVVDDTPDTVDFANGGTTTGLMMMGSPRVIMLLWASFLVASTTLLGV